MIPDTENSNETNIEKLDICYNLNLKTCNLKVIIWVYRNGWIINCVGILRIMVASPLSESHQKASGSQTLFYTRSKFAWQSYTIIIHHFGILLMLSYPLLVLMDVLKARL